MNNEKIEKRKYKISILGDSISTYEGYNPRDYKVYYKDERLLENELENVKDTWWMRVIEALDGTLCINNSFSGSTVTGESFPSACSDIRCANLHGNTQPDLILAYIGTNDRGFEQPIGIDAPENPNCFYGAYRQMLFKLKKNYPQTKIICGTIPMGKLKDGKHLEYDRFMRDDPRYNEAIRRAVREENCLLVDLAAFKERYETLDFCHPTKSGHKTLADLWLKALEDVL